MLNIIITSYWARWLFSTYIDTSIIIWVYKSWNMYKKRDMTQWLERTLCRCCCLSWFWTPGSQYCGEPPWPRENFESCVWRTVSSQSSHHTQEVLLAQFSLYVHKSGLKPDSFHFEPLVQDFRRNIIFLPSQSWDIVSKLCHWARHSTLNCFIWLKWNRVSGRTEMAMCTRWLQNCILSLGLKWHTDEQVQWPGSRMQSRLMGLQTW